MHAAMKPRPSPDDSSRVDTHAITVDCDQALAPYQGPLSMTVIMDRTDRLQAHLDLLMSLVQKTPADARGLIVNRALRDAEDLTAKDAESEPLTAWVHMRALARVIRLLCLHRAPCAPRRRP